MLLLLKNHKVKRKDDRKVTKKDLQNSKYIMIDTAVEHSPLSKNYVIVDPSTIPWFTKARIKYQMLFLYDDHDEGMRGVEPIPPVDTEVKTVADVINIINCIDRLYIVNQLLSNDQYLYTSMWIIIGYFEVTLYNENKKVYHKVYNNKDNLEESYGEEMKFPLKALKKFKDIYDTRIIQEMIAKHEFIFIHKDMTWSRSIVDDNYELIGIPLLGSRTMTLLTDKEYLRIVNIRRMSLVCCVVFTYDESQELLINELITKEEYDELGEINYDYLVISQLEYGESWSVPYRFIYLDIFSHVGFSIRLINVIYYHVEGFDVDLFKKDEYEGIDTIVSLNVKYGSWNKKETVVYMNEYTLIPLDNILLLI